MLRANDTVELDPNAEAEHIPADELPTGDGVHEGVADAESDADDGAPRTPGVVRGRQVWCAVLPGGFLNGGFLVTEEGDIDRVIAFVPDIAQEAKSYREAKKIARDPSVIGFINWGEEDRPHVDLRSYGKIDSNAPMPGFVYGLRCFPVLEEPSEGEQVAQSDVPAREPRPFCRFLLADLNRRPADPQPAGDHEPRPNSEPGVLIGPCALRAIALARRLYHLAGDFDDMLAAGEREGTSIDGGAERIAVDSLRRTQAALWEVAITFLQCEDAGDYSGAEG